MICIRSPKNRNERTSFYTENKASLPIHNDQERVSTWWECHGQVFSVFIFFFFKRRALSRRERSSILNSHTRESFFRNRSPRWWLPASSTNRLATLTHIDGETRELNRENCHRSIVTLPDSSISVRRIDLRAFRPSPISHGSQTTSSRFSTCIGPATNTNKLFFRTFHLFFWFPHSRAGRGRYASPRDTFFRRSGGSTSFKIHPLTFATHVSFAPAPRVLGETTERESRAQRTPERRISFRSTIFL